MPTPLFALVRGATTPALSSLSVDLADPAGGDLITITGTNIGSAISCTVAGSPVTINANTSTSLTFTFPSGLASGGYFVQVTTAAGSSNTLLIEAWAPTTDPACTLLFDSKHTPYNPIAGTWSPRYSAVAGATLAMNAGSSENHAASGGAPVFDGNGAVEGGLKTSTATWAALLGAVGLYFKGSLAVVSESSNTDALYVPANAYLNPASVTNAIDGTPGQSFGLLSGVSTAMAHIYNGTAFAGAYAPAAANVMHATVSRWGAGGATTIDISLDGDLSGAGYNSQPSAEGAHSTYASSPVYVGTTYPGGVANQTFIGTVPAFAVLNDKASDAFITKFNKWRQARGWT